MSKRGRKLANEIALFIRQYARKRRPGIDPNDRHYSRRVEQIVKRMDPEELDQYLRDSGDVETALD